jgi:hypothetical protein
MAPIWKLLKMSLGVAETDISLPLTAVVPFIHGNIKYGATLKSHPSEFVGFCSSAKTRGAKTNIKPVSAAKAATRDRRRCSGLENFIFGHLSLQKALPVGPCIRSRALKAWPLSCAARIEVSSPPIEGDCKYLDFAKHALSWPLLACSV